MYKGKGSFGLDEQLLLQPIELVQLVTMCQSLPHIPALMLVKWMPNYKQMDVLFKK